MDEHKMQKLISELHNGNDWQRMVASYKLGKSKNPAAVRALIHAYNDKNNIVRQNAIYGLHAIDTQEALDFLNSQKENLPGNISISMDKGELNKTADGEITIGSDPTIMTWLGIIFGGVLALSFLALVLFLIADFGFDVLCVLPPLILLGYLVDYAYKKSQHGQVIIDPTSHKIISRKREINFDDIEYIFANQTHTLPINYFIPTRVNEIRVTFQARVTNGNPMFLGTISGDRASTEKKRKQILEYLWKAGLSVKF